MSICLHREEGAFPIRTQVLKAGDRYPLGVGAGSLAILAAMPDADVDRVIAKNHCAGCRSLPTHSPNRLRQLVAETRRAGFAVNSGLIVPGSWGIGAVVIGADGKPAGALSVAAIESRMGEPRRCEIARLLQAAATELSVRLRDLHIVSTDATRRRASFKQAHGALGGRSHLLKFQWLIEVGQGFRCSSNRKVPF
ncbi:hypothetical protein JIR23_14275 [Bradyrhizobium diazoefficiens]|nr:IclR family transcriptional regulator C-terminal domain-containing protein [Bradyrhizobium diazoefficiens]QQN66762.1 hypothetical protein JIR23_14275 [Bradyrhizobium diazoefficiens]